MAGTAGVSGFLWWRPCLEAHSGGSWKLPVDGCSRPLLRTTGFPQNKWPKRKHPRQRHCLFITKYRRQWHPTPVLLPGKSHGWRSLVGCSPWGCWELDTTERLHFHFPLSCVGEGNGNPLQCSCLENPRDGGAWWAAISGVTQSRTRLKRLSSSSSIETLSHLF